MKKTEIIKEISEHTGIEKAIVGNVLEDFMTSVKQHIINKEYVSLSGFGRFGVKKRAAKTARVISRNIPLHIPAHFIPAFKPSKKFTERVRSTVKEKLKNVG